MKTDKELLQLAARAVGLRGLHERAGKLCYTMESGGSVMWNPLESDADAFRLAVDLGFYVQICDLFNTTVIEIKRITLCEKHSNDKHAATRRAIVRAAVAIGEGME